MPEIVTVFLREPLTPQEGKNMGALLDRIPYTLLIVMAIFLLLTPFRPMPHVLEKLTMLKNGTLVRPIDIFDLFYHLLPTILLALKLFRSFRH
ncbi:MAG: hypothetical protein WAM73_01040 [Desulfobacterales bacterium]